MIVDHINNISRYRGMDKALIRAFDFFDLTNFENLEIGTHEIKGKDLFCIVSEEKTNEVINTSLEAHKKYIDIHYIISGSELIGFALKSNQRVLNEYDSERDYALYDGDMSLIKMNRGMFAIFYPDDLHMPGITDASSIKDNVKKLVMKIKIHDV